MNDIYSIRMRANNIYNTQMGAKYFAISTFLIILTRFNENWPRNDQEMTKKWPRNDQEMIKKWPRNDQEMTQKWPRHDQEMTQKWPRNDLEWIGNIVHGH